MYFGRQKLEEYLWRCTTFSRSFDLIFVSIADNHRSFHHFSNVLPAMVGTKGLDTWWLRPRTANLEIVHPTIKDGYE